MAAALLLRLWKEKNTVILRGREGEAQQQKGTAWKEGKPHPKRLWLRVDKDRQTPDKHPLYFRGSHARPYTYCSYRRKDCQTRERRSQANASVQTLSYIQNLRENVCHIRTLFLCDTPKSQCCIFNDHFPPNWLKFSRNVQIPILVKLYAGAAHHLLVLPVELCFASLNVGLKLTTNLNPRWYSLPKHTWPTITKHLRYCNVNILQSLF